MAFLRPEARVVERFRIIEVAGGAGAVPSGAGARRGGDGADGRDEQS